MAGILDAFRGQVSNELLDDLERAVLSASGAAPVSVINFTDTNRPAADSVAAGSMIWNADDNAPNFAGGPGDNNWYDASGNIT